MIVDRDRSNALTRFYKKKLNKIVAAVSLVANKTPLQQDWLRPQLFDYFLLPITPLACVLYRHVQ